MPQTALQKKTHDDLPQNARQNVGQTSLHFASHVHTPLGYIGALCDEEGLLAINWQQTPLHYTFAQNDVSRETITQLQAYLAGRLTAFSLPISSRSVSKTFHAWLAAIGSVPYGKTVSYAELAGIWGNPKAARAAGSACQKNPLPIIIPCHRIIGSDGSYDKYSGGDITAPSSVGNVRRKKALLDLEAGLLRIL